MVSGSPGISVSQTGYINPFNAIGFSWQGANAVFRTEDHVGQIIGASADATVSYVNRTYHRDLFIQGIKVENYITTERYVASGGLTTGVTDAISSSLIDQSIVKGGVGSLLSVASMVSQARSTSDAIIASIGDVTKLTGIGESVSRAIFVAAERFQDVVRNIPDEGDVTSIDSRGPVRSSNGMKLEDFYILDSSSNKNTLILGGAGFNSVGIDLSHGVDVIQAGSGNDVIMVGGVSTSKFNEVFASDGDDVIIGSIGKDHIFGGGEDDFIMGRGGGDFINGGAGFDVVSYRGAVDVVRIDMSTQVQAGVGAALGDTLTGIEAIVGTEHEDYFKGNGGVSFFGDGGDDEFHLAAGDSAFGGIGDDDFYITDSGVKVIGGADDDRFYLNAIGHVDLDGGDGYDTLDLSGLSGVAVFYDMAGKTLRVGGSLVDAIDLTSFEAINLANTSYSVIGTVGVDHLTGWSHSGAIHGVIRGGAGDDILTGGYGDTLIGGADKDVFFLFGGDMAIGGSNSDTFNISSVSGGNIFIKDLSSIDSLVIDGNPYHGSFANGNVVGGSIYHQYAYPSYKGSYESFYVETRSSSFSTKIISQLTATVELWDYGLPQLAREVTMIEGEAPNVFIDPNKIENFFWDKSTDVGVIQLINRGVVTNVIISDMKNTGLTFNDVDFEYGSNFAAGPGVGAWGSPTSIGEIHSYQDSAGMHASLANYVSIFSDYMIM